MSSEAENNLRFEIGHVLFIDIVGYSKLLIEDQKERLDQLTKIVLGTAQVRDSTDEQLVRLPTGDGMALVFRHSAEEPARCALEIAEALRKHPEIPVRMGLHSGPVSEVTDVSGRSNLAGAGINMAQRVMDCGDAGHILLSKRVAEDLESYRQWAPHLHSLGECEVKHGVRVHVVSFYTDEVGNAQLPEKFRQLAEKKPAPIVSRREEELRIAVLPFKSAGDAETESFRRRSGRGCDHRTFAVWISLGRGQRLGRALRLEREHSQRRVKHSGHCTVGRHSAPARSFGPRLIIGTCRR